MQRASFSTDNIVEIELTCGSDYSGDTVTRSNYEYCLDELVRFDGIYDLYGDYSGYGIGYIKSELSSEGRQAIAEIESKLESYSLLDEDNWSMLEMNLKNEYWDSESKNLLKPWLSSEEETSDLPEKMLESAREIFENLSIIETGQLVYCNADRFQKELAESYPITEIYFDGQYRIVRAYRGLTSMYCVSGYDYIEANDKYLSPIMLSASTIAEYSQAGLFSAIESFQGA